MLWVGLVHSVVRALDCGAGEVCALSALCAIIPSFTQSTEDLPPHGWPVSGQVVLPSCQRTAGLRRRLGALVLIAQIICSLCGLRLGVGVPSKKSYQAVWFNNAQLTIAKKCVTVSGEVFWALVLPLRWLRRHGTCGSVLSRAASPREARRRMNCYFHSSTVFQMRRETLKIYFWD